MAVNNSVGEFGIHFITFAIFAFAFSSLIGNYFYAENNLRFIKGDSKALLFVFRVVCLCVVFCGAVNSFDLAGTSRTSSWLHGAHEPHRPALPEMALAALDDYTRQRRRASIRVRGRSHSRYAEDRMLARVRGARLRQAAGQGVSGRRADPEYVGLN
ncbi:MAG: alanine:cation symporter family protein [Eggerthellaceae bacterium]